MELGERKVERLMDREAPPTRSLKCLFLLIFEHGSRVTFSVDTNTSGSELR
jgi:hypothetical protein